MLMGFLPEAPEVVVNSRNLAHAKLDCGLFNLSTPGASSRPLRL